MEYMYRENNFWSAVYGWMAGALTLTAVTAWYVAATPQLFAFFIERPLVLILLFVAQISMVFIFTAVLKSMHFWWALFAFCFYALTLGITLSVIFKVYVESSIFVTFFVAAGMFGCMALYGFFTRTDLSNVGSIMIMMLFGIIICTLINFFMKSSAFETAISFVGVVVFALLTAYDMQKIRSIEQGVNDDSLRSLVALNGAFTLYLDFINLFLMLLRLTGKRNND